MKLKQLDMEDLGTVRKLFVKIFSQEPWNDCWDDPEQLRHAFWARNREIVPMPQYRSHTVSSPVSPAYSRAVP